MASEQEQELSLFELASAKLSDAQKLMTEARDLLRQDLNNARQEKSAIEEITNAPVNWNPHPLGPGEG